MQMTSSCMFLAYYGAKSMPMHRDSICLARGVLVEHPCHATDPYWHDPMPLVMLVMTWQPYSFKMAVSSSPKGRYLRQKYVRRIITVSRIVLLWNIQIKMLTCQLACRRHHLVQQLLRAVLTDQAQRQVPSLMQPPSLQSSGVRLPRLPSQRPLS